MKRSENHRTETANTFLAARKEMKCTQKQLASMLAVAPNHIALLERGARQPSGPLLRALAYALELSRRGVDPLTI